MKIALCQMTSGDDFAANFATAERLVRRSAAQGARLIGLPEYVPFYGAQADWKRIARQTTADVVERFSALAKELGVYLALGSVLEDIPGSAKVANTSIVVDPAGMEIARYRKIHLFDVTLPDRVYRESDTLQAGDQIVTCKVDEWTVGLSICFDVRFPEHYAALVAKGANLILVPSAFTAVTGKVHWEPLLRARAIETQCYLAAAAQTGQCMPGKKCHGHSMIVDPWGIIVGELTEGEGIVMADIDLSNYRHVRASMPLGRPGASS